MKRSLLLTAAVAAIALVGSASAQAAEEIYDFSALTPTTPGGTKLGPDSFAANSVLSVTQSTTAGVGGSDALQVVQRSPAGTYDQGGAFTTDIPKDLPGAASVSFYVSAADLDNYFEIQPTFQIDGLNGDEYRLAPAAGLDLTNIVGTPTNVQQTLSLDVYNDPDAGTTANGGDGNDPAAVFTPAQIVAYDSAFEGTTFSVTGFQFLFINGGSTDGAATNTFDISDVTVPSAATPEPASLGLIAAGGLLLGRRRRSC